MSKVRGTKKRGDISRSTTRRTNPCIGLAVSQDPFFRLVSKLAKKPTDDPQFKFTERRGSWHKRYAYLVKHGSSHNTAITTNADAQDAANDTWYGQFGTDYASAGNKTNVFGQTTKYQSGDAGTKPEFFLVDQLLQIHLWMIS